MCHLHLNGMNHHSNNKTVITNWSYLFFFVVHTVLVAETKKEQKKEKWKYIFCLSNTHKHKIRWQDFTVLVLKTSTFQSYIQYPASYIQHSTYCILHPTSSILHPAFYINFYPKNPILSYPIQEKYLRLY